MKKHPFALRRYRASLTQVDLAERLGVTRHMVIRLEQGLFRLPPDHITQELAEIYGVEQWELIGEYRDWQREKRLEFKRKNPSFKEVFGTEHYLGPEHPLTYYREKLGLSRIGLCKGLCLHPDPITDWEHNKQRGVPSSLKEACGVVFWDYTPLETAVTEWRMDGRADAIK